MSEYLLPPFGEQDQEIGGGLEPGAWRRAPGTLAQIGASLHGAREAAADEVKSAPDPWAQIRTVSDALRRPGDPVSRPVVAQWRGLLAVLALHEFYDLRLDLRAVRLDDGERASRFEKVLLALPPPSLEQRARAGAGEETTATWRRPILLRAIPARAPEGTAKPIPLGVLNPACLVAPGRDGRALRLPGVPWAQNGLDDPLKLDGERRPPAKQLAILREYVAGLRAGLVSLSESGTTPLGEVLDRYHEALVEASAGWATPVAATPTPPLGTALPPLYEPLFARFDPLEPEDAAASSACRIRLRDPGRGLAPPFEGVILIDPALERTRGRFAADILVWGSVSLAEVLASETVRERVRARALEAGWLLVTPEELLTRRLVKLTRRAVVTGAPESLRGHLLPVSPLALLVMSPEGLRRAAVLTERGEGEAAFSLSLRLEGAPGLEPVEHRMQRVYAASPAPGQGRLSPKVDWDYNEVAVWPDFTSPDWGWWFTRLASARRADRLRARAGVSGALLAELAGPATGRGARPAEDRAAGLAPWIDPARFDGERDPVAPLAGRVSDSPALTRLRTGGEGAETSDVLQLTRTPVEAIAYTVADEAGGPLEPAGLALLAPTPAPAPVASELVAIDFGSTNTVACFASEDGPVAFHTGLLRPFGSADASVAARGEDAGRWALIDFMPPAPPPPAVRATPTPTVALRRAGDRGPQRPPPEVERLPLFVTSMYFQPDPDEVGDQTATDLERLRGVLARARFNLKWSMTGADDREAELRQSETTAVSERYLLQLMLMCGAEAVRRGRWVGRWRFSRPDAMTDDRALHRALESNVELYNVRLPDARAHGSRLDAAPSADPRAPSRLFSESVAAANFVLSRRNEAVKGTVNIILDIGGSTTDVAVWSRNRLHWKGSFGGDAGHGMAGGLFFTRHIINNPQFLTDFGLEGWAEIIAPSGRVGETPLARADLPGVGELLFSSDTLNRRLAEGWDRKASHESARRLQATAMTFLGGIVFHLGRTLRRQLDSGAGGPDGLTAADFATPAFGLCGRGATLFRRIHGEGAASNALTPLTLMLRVFKEAAGFPDADAPVVHPSTAPKLEVARGMVIEDGPAMVLGAQAPETGQPLGLGLSYAGAALPPSAELGAVPAGAASPGRPDLGELDAFLEMLERLGGLHVDIDAGGSQSLREDIKEAVLEELQRRGAHLREPPFVTALRRLVEDLGEPAGSRAQRARVGPARPRS